MLRSFSQAVTQSVARTAATLALGLAPVVAMAACGGTVSPSPIDLDPFGEAGVDSAVDSGHLHHDSALDAPLDGRRDSGVTHDTYVDPGCGDATPPPILKYECDPFAKPTTCPKGDGCFPYVLHPSYPCSPETYGASCYPAGTGTQGTPCDGSPCASGFVCVVSGSGNICASMCKVGKASVCDDGLVCSPIDVPGYGACL